VPKAIELHLKLLKLVCRSKFSGCSRKNFFVRNCCCSVAQTG